LNADLFYAVDSSPPRRVVLASALQHVGLASATLTFPRLVAEAAGLPPEGVARYMSISMLALGIASLAQCYGRRGVGSGLLLPASFTGFYLPLSITVASQFGLSAVAGMTIIAGGAEMLLSRVIFRLRRFVPSEVVGMVVLMLGGFLGSLAIKRMLAIDLDTGAFHRHEYIVGIAAACITIAIAIWAPPKYRYLAPLAGLTIGPVLHWVLPPELLYFELTPTPTLALYTESTFRMPSLAPTFVLGFVLAAISCAVRAVGDIVTTDQVSHPAWKREDYTRIKSGLLADGLGCMTAGILGTTGTNTYSGSAGLVSTTNVASRRVATTVGLIWVALALVPGAPSIVLAIPTSALGGVLLFTSAGIVRSGFRILSDRMLDMRRSLALALAFVFALTFIDIDAHGFLTRARDVFAASSISVAMLSAVVLGLIFRLGTSQTASRRWRPEEGTQPLLGFFDECGKQWGARAQLLARAQEIAEEFASAARELVSPNTSVDIQVTFIETELIVSATWFGRPFDDNADANIDSTTRPSTALELALIRRQAIVTQLSILNDGRHRIRITLDDH
jgi:xanthine/uracil permease